MIFTEVRKGKETESGLALHIKEGDLFLFFISDANHVRASVHQKRDFQAPYINTILGVERSWGRYLTKCLSLRSIFDASLKFILSLVNFEPFDHFFCNEIFLKVGSDGQVTTAEKTFEFFTSIVSIVL